MKKRLLPIALLVVLGLAACNPTTTTTTTTEPTTDPTTTEPTTTEPSEEVAKSFSIKNKDELQAEWKVGEANRAIEFESDPVMNVNAEIAAKKLVITSSDPTVVTVIGKNLSALKAGTATITATWRDKTDTIELTILDKAPVMGLKALREGIAAGELKEGAIVDFYGEVTATMEPSEDHLYSGIYVQDGEYAMMVYAGSLGTLWFENNLAIGDKVYVNGTLAPYNGLNEVKPTELRKIEDGEYEVAEPTALEITAETYNATSLLGNDGRLFTMKDLTYVDGKITDVTAHTNINFEATKEDGTKVPVVFRANYHLGKTAMTELKEVVDGLSAGTKVDLTGVISWFNTPQLAPQFLAGKTPAQNITVHAQPDPTGLTINGPTEVKATETIDLTVTSEPAGSSPAVTWTSSDETVATVDANGTVTGVKEGKVTITATSKVVNTLTATHEVTVTKAPVLNGPTEAAKFEVGGSYKMGVYQGNNKKDLFLTGEMAGNFGATTENYADAATFVVGGTEDAYTLKTGDKYLGMTQFTDGEGKLRTNVTYLTEEFTWKYNAEFNTFTQLMGEDEYYLGTYGTFDTFSASKLSYAATSFVSHLYDYVVNPTVVEGNIEGDHYIGLNQENLGCNLYLTGAMDGSYYGATTKNISEAAVFTVTKSGEQYTVKTGENYLALAEGTKVNFAYSAEEFLWDYNAEYNTFTKEVGGEVYYLGTYNTFDTFSASKLSFAATSFVSHLYDAPEAPEAIGITISGNNEVTVTQTIELTVKAYPSAAFATVTWESSDTSKATVENGVVTGVAAGEVVITATSTTNPAVKATFNVTVKDAPAGMTTATLDCTVIPEGGAHDAPVGTIAIDENITFAGDKGTATTNFRWWDSSGKVTLRCYAGNTAEFNAAEGKQILTIKITADVNVVGTITNGTVEFADGVTTITVTDGAAPVSFVTVKAQITSISVVYSNI